MERETYYDDFVYVVHDFLSSSECNDFIRMAEHIGFSEAPVTTSEGQVMNKDVRNNSGIMKDDQQLADQLWERAHPWVTSPWE